MAKRYDQASPGRKNGRKKFSLAAIELAACIALAVVMIGAVVGKYLHKFDSNGSVRAMDFYFTGDFLDGKTHALTPGTTELSFTMGNHADELRFSEMDIKYTVTVTKADGTAADGVTIESATGTLTKGVMSDKTVTVKDLTPGTYTITAVGEGGYTKTLTAKINIPAAANNVFYHKDSTGDYILLTVWNDGDTDGSVAITYTGIPDNTNPNMTDWAEGSETNKISMPNITIAAHESKVFRFFSGDVEVTGAEPGTPA